MVTSIEKIDTRLITLHTSNPSKVRECLPCSVMCLTNKPQARAFWLCHIVPWTPQASERRKSKERFPSRDHLLRSWRNWNSPRSWNVFYQKHRFDSTDASCGAWNAINLYKELVTCCQVPRPHQPSIPFPCIRQDATVHPCIQQRQRRTHWRSHRCWRRCCHQHWCCHWHRGWHLSIANLVFMNLISFGFSGWLLLHCFAPPSSGQN